MTWDDVTADGGRGEDPNYPLSPSAIKTYMRCPKQFEFAYMKGLKKPPNFKMAFGSSIHRGLEVNYAYKYKKKKDLPVKDVISVFHDDLKVRAKNLDEKVGKTDLNLAVAEGQGILDKYHKMVAPRVQPVQPPELELTAPVSGAKRKLRGFLDLVADVLNIGTYRKNVIRDTKTTTRKYTQDQANTDIQLTIYDYMLKTNKGIKSSAVQFDVIVRGKHGTEFSTVTANRTNTDHKRLESTVQQVEKAISAGIFYPTENHQTCGWCGYRTECWGKGVAWSR